MDPRFSFLTFPQRLDDAGLHLNILVVPRLSRGWDGDPLAPVITDFPAAGDTTPAFADAHLRLEVRVLDGLGRFPVSAPVDFVAPLPLASGHVAGARRLFEALVAPGQGRFQLAGGRAALAESALDGISVHKFLPRSYRDSFLFTGPRHPNAVIDDSYACAIKTAKYNEHFVSTPSGVNWGQIYAYCLRHPQLARCLGLIREASFPVDGRLARGGFVSVDLAPGSDYADQAAADYGFLARYAARIPALKGSRPRPLFAAVQFPVLFQDPATPTPPAAPGNYDAVLIEASDYDDGFTKIVHATQPVSQNLLAEDPDGFTPVTDIGIRLGWDDEQILIWHSRQLAPDPTAGGDRLDAPLGAYGYRIDARDAHETEWHSLVHVRSRAPLELGGLPLVERRNELLRPPDRLDGSGRFDGELCVEVHPQQFDGQQPARRFWLPAYLAQWSGTSLVIADEVAAALYGVDQKIALGRIYEPVGLENVLLRYGRDYQFRVRLTDPTGGGPLPTDEPIQAGRSPIAEVRFLRHVVPEAVPVAGLPQVPEADAATRFEGSELVLTRPSLGYPSVVFTGKYPDPVPPLIEASAAAVGVGSFGLPDPDVRRVHIDVEVRALRMDNLLSLSGREAYALLYSTSREFPADADFSAALTVPLVFVDAHVLKFGDAEHDLGSFERGGVPLTQSVIRGLDELPLPTGRDIRLTLRAEADEDRGYFAEGAHLGKPVQVRVRREADQETDLFAKAALADTIRGIYLKPDPPAPADGWPASLLLQRPPGEDPLIVQRLAAQIGVGQKGLTLVGQRGRRVIFGCSRGIRHTLAPDHSSLTFAGNDDLYNHWIVAVTLQLDRDWTWDGLERVGFEVFRTKRFGSGPVDDHGGLPVGDLEVIPTASLLALDTPGRHGTTLVFLDAVDPKSSDPASFPRPIELEYRIEPRFRSPAVVADAASTWSLELPVTTPPAQVPRLVSAGLALSEYRRNPTYSATEPRRRYLWIEFEAPPTDPDDGYFIRLLAYAPDQLLSDDRVETWIAPEEPPLAIDPELVRTIAPDGFDDHAGLGAMTQLVPSDHSRRHYLVPLPPGLQADSPELFGLFTYELRVGHADVWSTAQGRFGRPLRSTGVQHPAPTLFCTCHRDPGGLTVEAPYAKAVLNGKNITADPPRTELWALLYAQVRRADNGDWRNILLDDRRLERLAPPIARPSPSRLQARPFENLDAPARAGATWDQGEIEALLGSLGLALGSPLSVLCVEMMPTLYGLLAGGAGPRSGGTAAAELRSAVIALRGGAADAGRRARFLDASRPLSDRLGHHRILRTSPLTAAPRVC